MPVKPAPTTTALNRASAVDGALVFPSRDAKRCKVSLECRCFRVRIHTERVLDPRNRRPAHVTASCDNKPVIRYWARASTIRDDDYSADRIDARDVATDVFHTGWREHLVQRTRTSVQ
jgi:hypothetical protein